VYDEFNRGGVPAHWHLYDGRYGSGTRSCAAPSQVTVSGGALQLRESYRASGRCGAGWYTAGMALSGFSAVDQEVTVRWRVVRRGVSSHHIIPMRWPDDESRWTESEEDWCEGSSVSACSSFLHYGSTGSDKISHRYAFDQRSWHTISVTRLGYSVRVRIDGALAWSFTGSPSNTALRVRKHVVLQQEARATPASRTATEDIQIDWIKVAVPR